MTVDVRVVAVPVVVARHGPSDLPVIMGLAAEADAQSLNGPWAAAPVGREARDTAWGLVSGLSESAQVAHLTTLLKIDRTNLQPVEFVDRDDRLVLIYTLALPSGWTEVPSLRDRWIPLCKTQPSRRAGELLGRRQLASERAAPYGSLILDHWRQLLEETPAVLSFLAPFFTLAQARDVYSAVWGYTQDANHWREWAEANLAGRAYESAERKDVSKGFSELLANPAWPEISGMNSVTSAQLVQGPQTKNWTGTSGAALGEFAASLVPGAALGALTSAVAHQVVKPRGKASPWKRALLTRDELYDEWGLPREQLKNVYSPRPTWQTAGESENSTNRKRTSTYTRTRKTSR